MFFTQEDYKKIQTWLNQNAIKDSEFKEASLPLNEYDIISFVQNGNNVKVRLKDFLEQLFLLREFSDFINVTYKYKAKYILLKQAIQLVPYKTRKIGQVITFLNEEKEWKIYQFKGESVNQWNEESLWEDIVKAIQGSDLVADEEDLTEVVDEVSGKSLLKLKDKTYDPDNFSGLGRVILRKNIVTVLNPDTQEGQDINLLTQQMINKPNTIYEIQYDFDLNNQEITIPEGCVLDFKGGSLSNGSINFNNTLLKEEIFIDCEVSGNITNKDIYVKWFNPHADGITDDSRIIRRAYILANKNNAKLIFDNKIYMYGDGLPGDDGTGNSYEPNPKYNNRPWQDINHPADIGRDIRMIFVNKNNISIIGNGATLLANPNNGECKHNSFIWFYRCNTILIENLKIEGNKTERRPKINDYNTGTDEWDDEGVMVSNTKITGYAQRSNIDIRYSNKIIIRNVISNESLMDGIVISGDESEIPNNIQIINCTCNFCYRMGLTLSSVNNCTVDGGYYSFNGYALDKITQLGTMPMTGIDIEADSFMSYNVEIKNTTIENNKYNGIVLSKDGRNIIVHHNKFIKNSVTTATSGGYNNEISYNHFYNGGLTVDQANTNIHHNIWQTDKYGGRDYPALSIVCTEKDSITTFNNNIIEVLPDGIDINTFAYYSCISFNGFIHVNDNTFKNICTTSKINNINLIISSLKNNIFINENDTYDFIVSRYSLMPYKDKRMKGFADINFVNNKLIGNSGKVNNEMLGNMISQQIICGEARYIIQRRSDRDLIYKLPELSLSIDVIGSYKYTIHASYRDGYGVSKLFYTHDNLPFNAIVPTEELEIIAYYKYPNIYIKIKKGFILPNRYFCNIKYDITGLSLNDTYYPEEVEETELEGATMMSDLSKSQATLPTLVKEFKGNYIVNEEDKIPYWLSVDNKWLNSEGIEYGVKKRGIFAEKPSSLLNIPIGYAYFCTDKQTTEGATNGIMIYHKGDNVWVDALGRVVS